MSASAFVDLDLEAGLAEATRQGKLLLVDATAEWCGPCKMMDRTTWADPLVIEKLAAAAVCIQIDVDQQRETAQRLNIKAMPTVVAFREHAEVDRVVGLQRPAQFITWLEGLLVGKTAVDGLRERASANPHDPDLRLNLAKGLMDTGRLEEACAEFAWLWEHMLEFNPAMIGLKHSFLAKKLERFVEMYSPARTTFEAFRQRVAPPRSGTPDSDALTDWFTLNAILGDEQASVRWFDEAWSTASPTNELRHVVERRIAPLLIAANRWADVGGIYADPLQNLSDAADLRKHADTLDPNDPPGMAASFRKYATENLRKVAAQMIRGLRAAGRNDEAARVDAAARELDGSGEMAEALSKQG